jgi:hypothetical protein
MLRYSEASVLVRARRTDASEYLSMTIGGGMADSMGAA